jgi:glycosyltransferase involved in cell wall biosynthesis
MKIAVITPYHKEPTEFLRQCHQSVLNQAVDSDHFFVADGCPNEELIRWNIRHVSLPQAHADFGDTPRGIGGMLADVEGYDFIAYLDADNWFHPNHLASLLSLWEATKADVCTSFRTFHTLDGTEMPIFDFDEESLDHVDTSCYLLHRNSFDALDVWLRIPKRLHAVGDRVFLAGLKNKNHRFVSTKQKTVAYRTRYNAHYLAANMQPPPDAKDSEAKEAYAWLSTTAGMKETLGKLGFLP